MVSTMASIRFLAIILPARLSTSLRLFTPPYPDEMTSCPAPFNEKLKANKANKVNH